MSTLSLTAARAALTLRTRHDIGFGASVDVYRLANLEGAEVRFLRIGSLEGVYLSQDTPTILLASGRPAGRISFTCAHELGHYVFQHGTRFDLLTANQGATGSEWLADMFAAFLLMPTSALQGGLRRRGWHGRNITPLRALMLAQWLGVSYGAFLNQSSRTLGIVSRSTANALSAVSPRGGRPSSAGP